MYSGNAVVARLAEGYNGRTGSLETSESKEYIEAPAGGAIMSVVDLDHYGQYYLRERTRRPAIAQMDLSEYKVNDHFSYGIGWELRSIAGHLAAYHTGGSNGYSSGVLVVPDLNISIAVASNRGSDDSEAFLRGLAANAIQMVGLPVRDSTK
jgi:CubicO group peptidase (beta-lactamase class C family)